MSFPKYFDYKDSGVPWLGKIPMHWGVGQSRRLFALRNERAYPDDEQLTASQKHGVIPQKRFMEIEGQKVVQVILNSEILKHVEPGDFVISMRSFQGGIEYTPFRGCISSAYVMLIPSPTIHGPFFKYLLKSQTYIQALQSTTNLVRDGQALRYQNFTMVDLPLVPPHEQTAIANFLDAETSKIDALVAEQRRLIELLKEKRQAVISHAVTKGLNPNAPMKDSGIEWLGDVPEHWRVGPVKHFVASIPGAIKTGPFGSHLKSSEMESGSIKVYNQRSVIDDDFEAGENFVSEEKFAELASFETFPGDVLVTTRGTIGRASILPADAERGILHPCLLRIQVDESRLDRRFLRTLIQDSDLMKKQLAYLSNATTIEVIYSNTMASVVIPVPPLNEQQEILEFLTDTIGKFDSLEAEAERAIELLQERRTALISAAVTGKIDVREYAALETT